MTTVACRKGQGDVTHANGPVNSCQRGPSQAFYRRPGMGGPAEPGEITGASSASRPPAWC